MQLKLKRTIVVFLAVLLGLAACTDKKPSNPNPNRPPETHLFLQIGDSLGTLDSTAMPDTASSKLVLHWFGDDPDGEVIGYEWAWNDTSSDTAWTFTDLVMDTFFVKIREEFNYFTFYIRAIDSDSTADPTPSYLTFPIINSPPTANFPQSFINEYGSEHSITLGYHTFTWTSSDPDGDETISGYELALMDTSFHWDPDTTINDTIRFADLDWSVSLDSLTYTYTFSNIEPGCYRVFLRTYDIAGSYSDVAYYPETTGVWQVIEANGEILYVDDNSYFSESADTVFISILDDLGLEYTALRFQDRSFYYAQDFESSLEDFNIMIYNAGSSRHFPLTSAGITNFINSGGHVMMNTLYSSSDTVTYGFMPVDSIYDNDIFRPFRFINPDTLNPYTDYPDTLQTTQAASFSYSFSFSPKEPGGLLGSGLQVLYTIGGSAETHNIGDTVAVRFPYDPDADVQEPAKLVFFSIPVFDCNVNDGFRQMFTHILLNEFADE